MSPAASGKKPDGVYDHAGSPVDSLSLGRGHGYGPDHDDGHGDGNGYGNGNGNGYGNDDGYRYGNGHGYGNQDDHGDENDGEHGNGNGNAQGHDDGNDAPPPTPAPQQEPAKQATSVTPATSSGANTGGPQPASGSQPQPPAATPAPAKPPKTATTRGGRTRSTAHARGRHRATPRRSARTPAARRSGPPARTGRSAVAGRSSTGPAPASGGAETAAAPHARGAHPQDAAPNERPKTESSSPIVRTLEHVVEVIPVAVKAIVLVLGLLLLAASLAWFLHARTACYLRRQKETLLEEVGVLQGALLPSVPAELSRLQTSVAYRPADGLAAGGDFYDAFALEDGRVGILVGDVAGHGRDALMHTALLRYTLRAYLEADLEPRAALQVAGRALDRGFETMATVVLAVYDPRARVLRYACAGHPPPVFLGEADHVPVTESSSPPIGVGLPTGLRQTTVCLPAGSAVCFFTDGLIEARRGDQLIGRLGLVDIIRELGPDATAEQVLERVAAEADRVDDDMAACMFRVADGPRESTTPRVEELEVRRGEPLDITLGRYLVACGIETVLIPDVIEGTAQGMRLHSAAVVQVSLGADVTDVQIRPANVETFASAEARRDATVFAARGG